LAGSSAGTSTAAASTITPILGPIPLEGRSDGLAAVSATTLGLRWALAGGSAGTSTVAASRIITINALAGASAGTSTVAALRLIVRHGLVGASTGTSTATANGMILTIRMVGRSDGTSSAVASGDFGSMPEAPPWDGTAWVSDHGGTVGTVDDEDALVIHGRDDGPSGITGSVGGSTATKVRAHVRSSTKIRGSTNG
jgi:hypothetical protein